MDWNPYSNGALYSMAICKTFPLHKIAELNSQKNCNMCNSKAEMMLDFPSQRLLTSSFEASESGNRNLYSLLLMLKTVNSCNKIPKPTATDFAIFKQILSILNNNKITMRGAFYEYRKPTDLPRGKTGRSDLDYPVCWWSGNDGINEEALNYWFHSYDEIVA